MHWIVELAKQSIETYVRDGQQIAAPKDLPAEFAARAGVFVSLKKHGNLRGCIGTFEPTAVNIAEEVIRNAIAASTRDPRFPAVSEDELREIEYSVDVLSAPEKVSSISELDPRKYGVIVSHGMRRGLLLPDLEGVDTVEDQLRITRMKAGIHPADHIEIYRFTVTRYR